MGGRGSSSGISDKGNHYGSQYRTVLKSGNIKFVEANDRHSESLFETQTKLTTAEKAMIERVSRIWYNRNKR